MSHELRDLTHRISDALKGIDPFLHIPCRASYGSQASYVIRHSVHYAIGGNLTYSDIKDISSDYVMHYGGWEMFELFFNIGDALQC